ncbi:MAG TPA: RsmE family RNA methyltransferase [Kofleriaceae bacterium]|nr:RsmE family RNA methyltransferase [Kofleriaceae bacterium]
MNLLLVDPGELTDGEVVLAAEDRRARHIAGVLRAAVGQELRAGVVGGGTGRARLVALEPMRLRLVLDRPAPPAPEIELVLAVPRPKALSRVVQAAASSGVARIDLTTAWKVDRSYLDSPRLDPAALAADARLGCEQGATTHVPAIALHRLFVPFVDATAPSWAAAAHRVVAHPRAGAPLESAVPPGAGGRTIVAIGPEGGWIDRELETFERLGFTAISLGAAVLRVESAVASLLGQLALLRRL